MIARLAFFIVVAASSTCRAGDLRIAEALATYTEARLVLFLKDYTRADIASYRYGRSQNVVHAAATNVEYPNAVKAAVQHGGDIDHQDDDGRTPLHYVIDTNAHTVAQILVELGANKNIEIASGHTALSFCEVVLRDQPDDATCAIVLAR